MDLTFEMTKIRLKSHFEVNLKVDLGRSIGRTHDALENLWELDLCFR